MSQDMTVHLGQGTSINIHCFKYARVSTLANLFILNIKLLHIDLK